MLPIRPRAQAAADATNPLRSPSRSIIREMASEPERAQRHALARIAGSGCRRSDTTTTGGRCAECGGRFGGDPQAGPLHDLVDGDSRHGPRRVATPDQAKTVKCRDLLGDGVLHTEALEASAQRLERGYGTGQAPLPDLRREVVAVGERCPWDRGDQCVIIEGTRRQRRPLQAGWNRALRAVPRGTEEIKLSV